MSTRTLTTQNWSLWKRGIERGGKHQLKGNMIEFGGKGKERDRDMTLENTNLWQGGKRVTNTFKEETILGKKNEIFQRPKNKSFQEVHINYQGVMLRK